MSDNNSRGLNGIQTGHTTYCSSMILPVLAMCLTCFLLSGVLPDSDLCSNCAFHYKQR